MDLRNGRKVASVYENNNYIIPKRTRKAKVTSNVRKKDNVDAEMNAIAEKKRDLKKRLSVDVYDESVKSEDKVNRAKQLKVMLSPLKSDIIGKLTRTKDLNVNKQLSTSSINASDAQRNELENKKFSTMANSSVESGISMDDNEENDQLEIFDAIKQTLSEQYLNVGKRLRMVDSANCLRQLVKCKDTHSANNKIIKGDMTAFTKLKILVDNDQPALFLFIVNNTISGREFPDKSLILLILELILTINKPSEDKYTTKEVIDRGFLTFHNMLQVFPPCWVNTNQTYRELLMMPLKRSQFLKSNDFDSQQTLFENLLYLLENIIQPDYAKDAVNYSINSEDFQDFFKWESKNQQKYLFNILSRDDKIDRIFITLSLLIKLLESDLTMWTIKNAKNPFKKIMMDKKMPMVAEVLWSRDEVGQINFLIKRIFQIFVNYVNIGFPDNKLAVIVRLINLIYHAMDLCEPSSNESNKLFYPNVYNQCESFCSSLAKAIEGNQAYSADLYRKVILTNNLPIIQLKLTTKLLTRLNAKEVILTPRHIYKMLLKQEKNYTSTAIESGPSSQATTTVNIEEPTTYPSLIKRKRKSQTILSDRNYTELILIAFKAYINVYHVKEIRNRLSSGEGLKKQCADMVTKRTAEREKQSKRPVITAEALRKNYKRLTEKEMKDGKNSLIFSHRYVDIESFGDLVDGIDIHVDKDFVLAYRENLKFLDLIENNTQKLQNIRKDFETLFHQLKCES